MNDRPTPETDALRDNWYPAEPHWKTVANLARRLERQRDELRDAIRLTLEENRYLADGENCTLRRLKDAIGYDKE